MDTSLAPDASVRHNPGAIPKVRLLNRLFYNPTLIGIAKSVVPKGLHVKLKQIQQLNLSTAPKLPVDLRAELLNHCREDILQLQELLDQDLSVWLQGA